MKKLIALDLDGTLLRDDKTVSRENINELTNFKNKGNYITVNTARPPRDVMRLLPDELKDCYKICYNGACILDKDNNMIYSNKIKRDKVLKFIKLAKEYNYNQISLEINDRLFSTFDTTPFFANSENSIVDIEKMEYEDVFKILIYDKNKVSLEFLREVEKTGRGNIIDNGTICQVMNTDVSKWSGVKKLSEIIGVELNNIISFGDDYNDYEVIKKSGIGVAMGNSEEAIKEIADYITDTNMNDGIAKFLKSI